MMQELSLNVLDVAQNSVSAGASLVEILLTNSLSADRLTIEIKDNGRGMPPEQVSQVIDPFYTTRTTRKVGLGVPFFKMAAEMCGGSFLIESTVGVGTQVKAVFVPSHVDCMPLGDMASTYTALMQCNPDMDFLYSYQTDGEGFIADTREFRQVLGDVSLGELSVVAFVKSFIEENTDEAEASQQHN